MKEKHYWGWPVAAYLFLGGLGGGMTIISTAADLFFEKGELFALGNILASILIGIGSGLLIFELGKPFRFWRVFSTQKAVMTVGAWLLGLLIVTGVVNFSFWVPEFPWSRLVFLRKAISLFNLLLGIGVITYTGVLLGSMKARPFWNNPALPVLFAISGLSTGTAFQSIIVGVWPRSGEAETTLLAKEFLHNLDASLLVLEILILVVYIFMLRAYAGVEAGHAVARWLNGSYALPFWGGLVCLGLLLPLALYLLGGPAIVIAPICVVIGGIFLRFLVVYSNDRKLLPGEEKYRSRLPVGSEDFLKAWLD